MNLGLDKSNFSRGMVYRAENLTIDKPRFITKIQFYFVDVPKRPEILQVVLWLLSE